MERFKILHIYCEACLKNLFTLLNAVNLKLKHGISILPFNIYSSLFLPLRIEIVHEKGFFQMEIL